MASFGQTAALLQIGVRADTSQATSALRRMDSTVSKSAANAKQLTTAQERQVQALRKAGLSYSQIAQKLGTTERELRRLSATATKNGQSMTRMASSTRQASQANQQLDRSTGSVTTKLKGAAKGAALAASAYVGIGAAQEAIDTTTDLAKATLGLHHNLGLSLKTSGAFAGELKARGADSQKLTIMTKTYANAIEGARAGTETQVQAFKTLGLTVKDLNTLNPDQIFFRIAKGAKAAGDTTERTHALGLLLGRQFGNLRAVFSGGAAGLKEFLDKVNEAGANVAQGKGIKGIQDLIEQQRQLKRESEGLSIAFTQNVAPLLIKAMQAIGVGAQIMRKVFNNVSTSAKYDAGKIVDAFHWILKVARDVAGAISGAWGKVKDVIAGTAAKISNIFGNLIDKLHNLGNVFGNVKQAAVSSFNAIKGPVVNAGKAIIGVLAKIVRVVGAVISAFGKLSSAPGNLLDKGAGTLSDLAGHIPGLGGQTGGVATRRGIVAQLQKGGRLVRGSGSGDKVPAMLEPGEVVWNREAVKKMGGPRRANAMNQLIPRFARGGGIADGVTAAGKGGITVAALAGIQLLKVLKQLGVGAGDVAGLLREAKRMDALHQPYLWGGGHAGFSRNGPWDCSGAVSQVLHGGGAPISAPMVSGAFEGYGLPGLGQGGKTGIWANAQHVWMTINGQGFSTSAENPGQGWGSVSYSSRPGFVKRHPDLSHVSRTTGQPLARGAQTGGIIQKFAGGGIVGNWRNVFGGSFDKNELTTLSALVHMGQNPLMGAIAFAESTGNPNARGGAGEYGLWQIMPFWGGGSSLLDPVTNAAKAKHVKQVQGLSAWTTYTSGAYRSFLGGQIDRGKYARMMGWKGKSPASKKPTKNAPTATTDQSARLEAFGTDLGARLTIPKPITDAITQHSTLADTYSQFGDMAQQLTTDTAVGMVMGKDEIGWLNAELGELLAARNQLILAWQALQSFLVLLAAMKAAFQQRIQDMKATIANLRAQLAHTQNKDKRKAIRGKIDKLQERITFVRGKIGVTDTARQTLVDETIPDYKTQIEDIQGLGFPFSIINGVPAIGSLGGKIFDVQLGLKAAKDTLTSAEGGSDTGETGTVDNSQLISLLQDQANKLAQQLYVSQQQYQVLSDFPYVGSFATVPGQMRQVPGPVGRPYAATVHGGEMIGTPGGAAQPIVVLVQDGAVNPQYIRVVAGREAERMARRAGRGRVPGNAGALQ